MALGAKGREVVTLVLWQGLRPALLGIGLGLVTAPAAGRLMTGLLYGVAPYDPLTVAAVSAVLLVVVAAACTIPARRASAVPPAETLRGE